MTPEIRSAIVQGLQAFAVPDHLPGDVWADRYFYLSSESSGIPGRWRCYPYQRAILQLMCDDYTEHVTLKKSRRVGYTKMLLATIFYFIRQKRRNVGIWQPTNDLAAEFTRREVDNAIRDAPSVAELMLCDINTRSKYNTGTEKHFYGCILDIRGAKAARNFRGMTKDVVILDEADGMERDVEGEGSPVDLSSGRTDQSMFPKQIVGSTPKYEGLSITEQCEQDADVILLRWLPCPHGCGHFQPLIWEEFDRDAAQFICHGCGAAIEYSQFADMDAAGYWATADGRYRYDEVQQTVLDINDNIHEFKHVALQIWAAYSYSRPWSWIADKYRKALSALEEGDSRLMVTFVNQILGRTYKIEVEEIQHESLMSHCSSYTETSLPCEIMYITAGTDVQKDRLETEVVGWGRRGENWSIAYHTLYGDPEEQRVWDMHDDVLNLTYMRSDGVVLPVSKTFIDSGYKPHTVAAYARPRHYRGVFATKGDINGSICNKKSVLGIGKRLKCDLYTINTIEAKDLLYKRLAIDEPGPGYCHFPDSYNDQYFKELTNEHKVTERDKTGHKRVKYKVRNLGVRNEPVDCRVYAIGAYYHRPPDFDRLEARLKPKSHTPAEPDPPAVGKEQIIPDSLPARPRAVRRRKKSFLSIW